MPLRCNYSVTRIGPVHKPLCKAPSTTFGPYHIIYKRPNPHLPANVASAIVGTDSPPTRIRNLLSGVKTTERRSDEMGHLQTKGQPLSPLELGSFPKGQY